MTQHVDQPSQPRRGPGWQIVFGLVAVGLGSAASLVIANTPDTLYLAVYILGAVALAATLARPEWGLMTLTFVTALQLSNVAIHYHHAPSLAQPLIALLLAVVAIRWVSAHDRPAGWERPAILLTLYGLAGAAALFFAASKTRALAGLIDYTKDALTAVLCVALLQRAPTLRRVVWTLLLAGIFLGTISVYQQLTGTFGSAYWGFGRTGLNNDIASGDSTYRVTGPFANPNAYAQVLVSIVPLALNRLWGERRLQHRILAGWALAVTVLSIFFTYSRGGFLALTATLGLMFLHRRPRLPVFILTFVIAIVLLQFLPAHYTRRILTLTDFLPGTETDPLHDISFRGRSSENQVAWLMFLDHPVLGVGADNYAVHYLDYSERLGIDPRREARSPASLYLEILAEQGLLGSVLFILLLGFTVRGLRQAAVNFTAARQPQSAELAVVFGIAIAGYLMGAIFKNSAYSNYFWLLIGIALAIPPAAKNALTLYQTLQSPEAERMRVAALPAGDGRAERPARRPLPGRVLRL